ncbi:unnamed protein product [Arctia plantaginis]|uniref:ABC transporter domain-containing protein n=1 Tax=Arctia plantaginis TaxID=874455 RepID=A0A8S0ZB32_ARCPL|nr:unnamed protein product [Arctia plantaginis]CAB3230091.1 unnamed protein product [Arctia plantaginis]
MDKFLWTRRLFLGSCVGSLNIPSEQCSVESQTTHVEQCSNSENTPSDKGLVYSPTTPFNVCEHCPTNSSITFRSKKSLELLISPNHTDSHSTSCQNTPTSAPTIPYKKGLQGSPITPYPQGTSISPCSVDLPPTTSTNDSQSPTYQKYTSLIKPSPMSTPKIPVPVQSPRVPPPLASLVAPGPKSAAVPRLGPVNSSTAPYQKIHSCPKPALCRGSPPTAPRSPTPQLPTVPQPQILQPPTAPPPKIVRTNFLADAWLKFRLLMWKNFLQQWRRSSQTAAEILLPLLTMTLVLLIRWQVAPTHRPMNSYPPLRAYSLYYSMQVLAGLDPGTLKIAYSPTSPILEEVLMSAMATLVAENKNLLSQNLDLRRRKPTFIRNQISRRYLPMIEAPLINDSPVIAFANSNELNGLYAKEKTTRTVLAAVEFDDRLSGATELPVNLSYSLRFPERPRQNSFYKIGGRDWKTDLVFPNYELTGPRFPFSYEGGNDPGYVNEWFIALQHSISTELISRSTGQDIHSLFDVLVQRFPHPPYWEDNSMAVLKLLFPMFVMLSTSYSAINIVRAIVVEKELQLKESMKIMGLPTWLHWTAWFWKQFIFQVLIAILMTILLKVHWFTNDEGYDNYAVFTHTSWTILLFFLMLYLCCMIFFCFMLSAFFSKGSTAALFTGVIWFLTFMPAFLLSTDAQISILGQILVCLFINTAMAFGFQLILAHECSGGLQWGRFLSSPSTERSRFMFGHVVTMLVVNCVLFMLITLYLEQISPGPFGAPRPWYFPFQSEFWCPGRKKSGLNLKEVANKWKNKIGITKSNTERSELRPLHAFYVSIIHAYQSAVNVIRKNNIPDSGEDYKIVQEKDPEHLSIGIKIENLTKIFGHNTVVNHLNFNVYNDQITVLLGHNGAGKTTTISMLTGNLQPTSGKVNVVGYDMSTQAEIARSHIGLCPQHNVLFDELTVREHLKFFSRLKGLTGTELKADIEELIKKLELESKRDYPSSGLSGGQKRRLCVGIALSGRAKVVLLDEPTSGMDPASRRALWDLLQNEKKQRSMILTTHFMDEADILGDRVAIMAQGRLQCVGSPYFLKRHYGVGYTLVVVKGDNFDTERCTALINNYIPNTVVKEDRGSEVTYSLPNEYSHKFEDMLNNLEQNANTIKFTNYGLLTTTLEDVFMSVGADLAPVKTEATGEKRHAKEVTTDEKETNEITSALEQFNSPKSSKTGHALLMQRMLAVWLKLSLVWRRSWWLVILQFVIPTLLLTAALGLLRYILSLVPTIKKRKLALTTGFEQTETLLGCNSNSTVGVLAAESYQEMFENANVHRMSVTPIGEAPMEEYYLNRTRDPIVLGALRYRILIGSSFSDNSVTAWFSNFGYHDVAVSLAAVHSALLKTYNPDAELTVYNHPLKATYADQTDMQMMISLISMQLSTGIGSSVAITTAVYIMFYIKERVSGAKLLQRSAGIHPAVMWGSAAIYDWIWLLIFCLPIPIACAVFEVPGLCTAEELGK